MPIFSPFNFYIFIIGEKITSCISAHPTHLIYWQKQLYVGHRMCPYCSHHCDFGEMIILFSACKLSINVGYKKSTVHSSGAVWESRWPSWAVRPNEPSGFLGRKELLNRASALVTTCPSYVNWHLRTLSITSSSSSSTVTNGLSVLNWYKRW